LSCSIVNDSAELATTRAGWDKLTAAATAASIRNTNIKL
jgi:hypothetical protein